MGARPVPREPQSPLVMRDPTAGPACPLRYSTTGYGTPHRPAVLLGASVWCVTPAASSGGLWWPLSPSGLLLHGMWTTAGARALC